MAEEIGSEAASRRLFGNLGKEASMLKYALLCLFCLSVCGELLSLATGFYTGVAATPAMYPHAMWSCLAGGAISFVAGSAFALLVLAKWDARQTRNRRVV